MSTILITGGTGLLGHRLSTLLAAKGHKVNLFSRTSKPAQPYSHVFVWDVEAQTMDEAALNGCDYIIHLAGSGIADKPWTEARKKDIVDSRVNSSNLLFNTLKNVPNAVKGVVSASAIGYYGMVTIPGREFVETDNAGTDFLGQCCLLWENAIKQMETLPARAVRIRIGIVLSTQGGALQKIAGLAKFGPAAAVGSGEQAMPWVHIDDLCNIFIKAIEDETMSGPYNAAAPAKDDSTSFTKAVAKQIHRPMLPFPAPSFAIRLMYGEMSQVVLEGTHASPRKILDEGFQFQYTNLAEALRDLYEKEI